MVTQEHVIDALHARFKDDPLVFALWLEGSDAFDRVDEYSDVDVVMDVEDGHEEATLSHVEDALRTLGDLDLVSPVGRPNQHLWHKVFHISPSICTSTLISSATVATSRSSKAIQTSGHA